MIVEADSRGERMRGAAPALAHAALEALSGSLPWLASGALPAAFATPHADIEQRILQIAASVRVDRPLLLREALRWSLVAFGHRGVPPEYLPGTLRAIEKAVELELPREVFVSVRRHVGEAVSGLESRPSAPPPQIDPEAPLGATAVGFLAAIRDGRGDDALALVERAIDAGVPAPDLLDHVFAPTLREIGRLWLVAELPVAEEHYGSRIVERALSRIDDVLPAAPDGAPDVLTMGVAGDLHDFGLRMVAQRLQFAGCRVRHLGGNMPSGDLPSSLGGRAVDVLVMSASMLVHLHGLADSIRAVRSSVALARGDGGSVPIVVGGQPFEVVADLHERLGADCGIADARHAPQAIAQLLQRRG